jgi:hypothetical protein
LKKFKNEKILIIFHNDVIYLNYFIESNSIDVIKGYFISNLMVFENNFDFDYYFVVNKNKYDDLFMDFLNDLKLFDYNVDINFIEDCLNRLDINFSN